jgi:hypothetical protein
MDVTLSRPSSPRHLLRLTSYVLSLTSYLLRLTSYPYSGDENSRFHRTAVRNGSARQLLGS